MKIIILVGLPGAGKTTLANKLGIRVVDDPKTKQDFPSDGDFVVCDPKLCNEEVLKSCYDYLTSKYKAEISIIYFENDLTSCLKNIEYRRLWGDEREVEGFAKMLSKDYKPINPIKVVTELSC